MDRTQFLNKIKASFDTYFGNDINRYFDDYNGPYDDDTAMEYVRYFTQNPGDLSRYATQGLSHRQSLMENGLLNVNSPIRPD
jgi:hypothetical protein